MRAEDKIYKYLSKRGEHKNMSAGSLDIKGYRDNPNLECCMSCKSALTAYKWDVLYCINKVNQEQQDHPFETDIVVDWHGKCPNYGDN